MDREQRLFRLAIKALDSERGINGEAYSYILETLPSHYAEALATTTEATDDVWYIDEDEAWELIVEHGLAEEGEL